MKVLVTGGAGFIGSHIVDQLIAGGYEVAVIDNLSTGKKENVNALANFHQVDINKQSSLEQVFSIEQPNVVIHHAAQVDVQTSLHYPVLDAEVNIIGTINLLQCCSKYNVEKLIYASSAAVYGDPEYLGVDENHPVNPLSFYGISKHTPEHYIKAFSQLTGLKYTILRYANVYGIRQEPKGEGGVISIFVDKLLQDVSPFIYGDGEQTRDFIYVKDVAKANLMALALGDNSIINISCNTQTTVNKLFSSMCQMLGKQIEPVYQPARRGDILHSYLDNSKAWSILGWKPEYSLLSGLKETLDYYSNLLGKRI